MKESETCKINLVEKTPSPNEIITYPKAPIKDINLRRKDKTVSLITNLFKIKLNESQDRIYVYSIEISPELAKDNFTLQNKIYKFIDADLSKFFVKKIFAGLNLFGRTKEPIEQIIEKTTVEEKEFTVTLKKVGHLDLNHINDEMLLTNLKTKNFIEKLIKDIVLSCKNTIKFGDDRTVVEITEKNVMEDSRGGKSRIYKGFYTSAQITESGLFLLALNVNKYVSGVTMLEKINQIRKENYRDSESEIRQKIEDYISEHKTVLTVYGSMRAYRIEAIDMDRTPMNTSFNLKKGGELKTITIFNYYKQEYKREILDKGQPLLIAEKRKIKSLPNNNTQQNDDFPCYLVPELLYCTGLENEVNSRDRRRDIISKTKTNPNERMKEINGIHHLINSDNPKIYKSKDGQIIKNKSSKEISQEWGINLGNNLEVEGRILNQPILHFSDKDVTPRNGTFRTEKTKDPQVIDKDNFVYIYDRRDRSDIRGLVRSLLDKGRMKGMKIDTDPRDIKKYEINETNTWDDIKYSLKKMNLVKEVKIVVVFLTRNLERFYDNLKEYFTNVCKVPTQFIVSNRLQDPRKSGSILFNIIEQINIKLGGTNFYIDFYNNGILRKDKIYLILALESRKMPGNMINYSLTCCTNPRLTKTVNFPKNCANNLEEIEKTLRELLSLALKELRDGGAPHPPDYIILYRQGGNGVQNERLKVEEVPIFLNYLKEKKSTSNGFKIHDPKFIYICCNLKGNLKFFETSQRGHDIRNFSNPTSGVCVDSQVVQKDRYEFFIQPQFVNQGTATPCHYEILHIDIDENNPMNNLKIEQIQQLSFYLSFYYWTWSGAVRVPGVLKMATSALDFYSKCLKSKLLLPEQKFSSPYYI